jgi:hypothetical protein
MATLAAARLGAIFDSPVDAALPHICPPTFQPPHFTGRTFTFDAGNVAHPEQVDAITCAPRHSIFNSVRCCDRRRYDLYPHPAHDAPLLSALRKGDVVGTSHYACKASANEGVVKTGSIVDRCRHAVQDVANCRCLAAQTASVLR